RAPASPARTSGRPPGRTRNRPACPSGRPSSGGASPSLPPSSRPPPGNTPSRPRTPSAAWLLHCVTDWLPLLIGSRQRPQRGPRASIGQELAFRPAGIGRGAPSAQCRFATSRVDGRVRSSATHPGAPSPVRRLRQASPAPAALDRERREPHRAAGCGGGSLNRLALVATLALRSTALP